MPHAQRLRAGLLFLLAASLGTGCDLGTKTWAVQTLSDGPQPIAPPWLSFQLAYNRGTAFSVARSLGDAMPWMALLAFALAAAVAVYVWRHRPDRLTTLALGGIVAGAIGNGWDRAFRAAPGGGTGVVDFIAVTLPGGHRWPTFNVADVLLAVGVGLVLIASLRKAPAAQPDPTPG
ncbi:MAG: signal peptidase II [Nannocystaceae bacterium]|nr:signal peptidase II [bacterium]